MKLSVRNMQHSLQQKSSLSSEVLSNGSYITVYCNSPDQPKGSFLTSLVGDYPPHSLRKY